MAIEHEEGVRPDMLILAKSLSGGMMPASGVVCDERVSRHIRPGDHGSTYAGNPLSMATCHAAVKTLVEEGMVENSAVMGKLLLDEISKVNSPIMKEIRGRGLFLGLEVKQATDVKVNGMNLVNHLRNNGVLSVKA